MAAESFIIEEGNGSPVVWTPFSVIVTGRYCTADVYNPGTNNPCKVPSMDFNYSFWKQMSANVSGTFNSIRDIYWYCDGSVSDDWNLDPDNDGGLYIGVRDSGDNGCPYAQYQVATGQVGVSGISMADPTNGHVYYRGQTPPMALADDYTAATPLLIDSTVYTSSFRSKMWCTQLRIPPTAGHGELVQKVFTLTYSVY